jgi:hypothetical protein
MSIESVTFSLPSDASYTTGYDEFGNPFYIITTSKENAPYLANLALQSLNENDQKKIPETIKEQIIERTGIKYVFTLPSVLRNSAIAFAAGITIKSLLNEELTPRALEIGRIAHDAIAYSIPLAIWTTLPFLNVGAQLIKNAPYFSSIAILGTSVATNFVPESVATLASDTAQATLNIAKKVIRAVKDTLTPIGKFSLEYPKTTFLTASVGLSFFLKNFIEFGQIINGLKTAR